MQSELITPGEAARRLGVRRSTLADWRQRGAGPRYIAVNRKVIRYLASDLDSWIDAHARGGE